MSPRAYQVGKRRELATEATRSRIIAAARALLADEDVTVFSIDAVAERADVARMTVYYQFKSKGKLIKALFDDFEARANTKGLKKAAQDPDPVRAIHGLVRVFCDLWDVDGFELQRLQTMAALDVEVQSAMAGLGAWRGEAIAEAVRRLAVDTVVQNDLVDMLRVSTSFEAYSILIRTPRTHSAVIALLQRSAAGIVAAFTAT